MKFNRKKIKERDTWVWTRNVPTWSQMLYQGFLSILSMYYNSFCVWEKGRNEWFDQRWNLMEKNQRREHQGLSQKTLALQSKVPPLRYITRNPWNIIHVLKFILDLRKRKKWMIWQRWNLMKKITGNTRVWSGDLSICSRRVYHRTISPSSSSCCAASTDIPDPLSLLLPIVHRLWHVFRATSSILTELLYVCSSWPSCFCSAICGGP